MYYNDDHQILRLWVARRLNSNWSQAGGLSIIVASPNINKYQKESNLYKKLSFKSDLSTIVASPNINKYQNESHLYKKSSFKSGLSIIVASSRQDETRTGIKNPHLTFDIFSPKSRDRIGHY